MHTIKYTITLCLLLLFAGIVRSQECRTEFRLDFRVNSTSVDSLYGDNATGLRELTAFLRGISSDSTADITEVSFCGAASPEGSSSLNRRLAANRLSAIENIVRRQIDLPDSIITRDDSYIPWETLRSLVKESDIGHKEEITAIIDMKPEYVEYRNGAKIDRRVLELQKLDNGSVWRHMNNLFFSRMRNACAVFVTYKKVIPPVQQEAEPVPVFIEEEKAVTDSIAENKVAVTIPVKQDGWRRHLHVKTNAIGWAMGVVNIAAEADLTQHWSLSVPCYWSSWNYFARTLKFRVFTLQPEVRFWLSEKCEGWFAGAHFGIGWYNIATDGDYRTQDHDGDSPAVGGGISLGYRLPLGGNGRWKAEFSLGAGVYSAHYDRFRNEPNGLLVDTTKKTWIGIDRACLSVVYSFGVGKKKGGER